MFGSVLTSLMLLCTPAASGTDQGQAPRVTIQFEPQTPTEAFVNAAAEYDAIWKAESARIVEAMERITGARFEEREIKAVVYEGTTTSG